MILKFIKTFILSNLFIPLLIAQTETYTVKVAPFSSEKYDEFSPVFFKNGIVFCTNRNTSLTSYSTSQNKGLFKIYYSDTTGRVNWQNTRILSKELTTKLNDGPATFNSSGDTIYYTRNLEVDIPLKDVSSSRNKLGLFTAVLVDGKWIKIKDLRINSEWYNLTSPCLSQDGKRLFFASDRSGGKGGFDLYYSNWKNGYWDDPINLGPSINTLGNEGYPFINPAGELFFSSDGHQGMGGKDIFFSRYSGTDWLAPVRLDSPVNSEYDDFGIITDSLINEGYFSSNRNKSVDIYKFKTNFPQIFYTNVQQENQYCFRFSDSGAIEIDTLYLKYVWDFGDGKTATGEKVIHCFDGPGTYPVKLEILDKLTGKLFFLKVSYNLVLKDISQPYINSSEVAVKGEEIEFDALKSFLPGYTILDYSWDFGDGIRKIGDKANHTYKDSGSFDVNLGLTLRSKTTGNIHKTGVSKKIYIVNSSQEKQTHIQKNSSVKPVLPDIQSYSGAEIETTYSAEKDFKQTGLFHIEVFSSGTKIGINSSVFRNITGKYTIIESFEEATGTYRYLADEQMSLSATYPAYRQISGLGFKNVQIKLDPVKDLVKKELINLKKNYGILSDTYFDNNNRLKSNAYLMLDQIVNLMKEYPGLKLEIGVHTDNSGTSENNMLLSQIRAQILLTYLVGRDINSSRLIAKGYGSSKPIALNNFEKDRKQNRRVDFTILAN